MTNLFVRRLKITFGHSMTLPRRISLPASVETLRAIPSSRGFGVRRPCGAFAKTLGEYRIRPKFHRVGDSLLPLDFTSRLTPDCSATTPHERSQGSEVLDILVEVRGFWGLQAARCARKSRVIDDVSKGFLANLPIPYVGMPIDTRLKVCLGIVQVERKDLLNANQR
jgi:hypothetical protein